MLDIAEWHRRGARYGIHVDPEDGLLTAGEDGVQLTWMDAKAAGRVITPRSGKCVEINALWYNALLCIAALAKQLRGAEGKGVRGTRHRDRPGFSTFLEY